MLHPNICFKIYYAIHIYYTLIVAVCRKRNMYKCNAQVITSFSNIVLQEKYETIENRDADENTNLFNEDIN